MGRTEEKYGPIGVDAQEFRAAVTPPASGAGTVASHSLTAWTHDHPASPVHESEGSLGRTSSLGRTISGRQSVSRDQSEHSANTEGDDSSLAHHDFWPRTDSDDSDGGPSTPGLKRRSSKAKTSYPSSSNVFHSIAKKFGRTFNKEYDWLPNDKKERERNEVQHQLIQEVLDGRLCLAPILKPKRVLDVGTGPGTWALEFAQRNPASLVLGIDLDPVNPAYKLPNCCFQTMDATEPWDFDEKFDFIHVRMLGFCPGMDKIFDSIQQNLNPGGWVEFTEWCINLQSPDHSFDGTSLYRWNRLLRKGLKQLGQSTSYPLRYETKLREMEFANISMRKYPVPMNPWPPGKRLQRIGNMVATNVSNVMDVITLPVFMNGLGWSQPRAEAFLLNVQKEVVDTRLHVFFPLVTTFAQMPSSRSSASLRGLDVMPLRSL